MLCEAQGRHWDCVLCNVDIYISNNNLHFFESRLSKTGWVKEDYYV